MKIGSLFSGIGGLELGLERAIPDAQVIWQVEQSPYARRVLAKHWPSARRYEDVKEVGAHNLEPVDIICGGFPCQDISNAGKGRGIIGERSGLWSEMFRLIRDVRPAWTIIENVSALRSKGLTLVLQNLSEIGYMGEFHAIPCSAIGGLHRRDRIWIIAYPNVKRLQGHRKGLEKPSQILTQEKVSLFRSRVGEKKWSSECGVPRILNGLPNRIQRIKALGNAVVPQIPQMIGESIWESHTTMNF